MWLAGEIGVGSGFPNLPFVTNNVAKQITGTHRYVWDKYEYVTDGQKDVNVCLIAIKTLKTVNSESGTSLHSTKLCA